MEYSRRPTTTWKGIYNRAIVILGKRSPYTQGLEYELKNLSEAAEPALAATALGNWLSGKFGKTEASNSQPLIEVLPMNSEQRAAVESALVSPHTVVTGPPGTGKSQVVTNLLINAAWRGMKVLFASKNNKAVDVVEARVNGLGNRPVLLRLGSNEYQAKLASYLTATLSGQISEEDRVGYEECLTAYKQLSAKQVELENALLTTMNARNLVDKLEVEAETARDVLGAECFHSLDRALVERICLRDQLRNQRLIELGWEVKRFWVYEVRDHLQKCVAQVTSWANGK